MTTISLQNRVAPEILLFGLKVLLCMCISDQRGHVSSVHLPAGDVLFGLRHGAHLEALWTPGPRADDGGQSDRARLHLPHLIKLLLENCGPETEYNQT